ncbi:DUF4344 domain-containing metallopeptidase [Streptomyces sp. TLI_146]|uniref:DUF4344 domain-containing metallopeptidase n=1 Tax=Streptomyces sp. TLI_146 TaxID=1938858 RepID=UPI000C70870B|nr:DUF4344 domain-containing metallopeptidase [Streptomyces sp. TLI_146]PKV76975.1 putative metallopeptidase DUF4344 [Streptomyces sp. TLI_146]
MRRRGSGGGGPVRGGRSRIQLYAGIASALLTLSMAACGSPGASSSPGDDEARPAPRTGFSVRYEPPSASDRTNAAFLRGRRVLEQGSAEANAFGRAGAFAVVGRSCGGEGSAYDPGARRIEICYDDVAQERELFEGAGVRPADDEVAAVLAETFFHEAGHALVDRLGLDLGDRAEEDAADQFAALMLIRRGEAGERQLRVAAREYELSAAAGDAGAASGEEARDAHTSDLVRASHHLCYLYGADPTRNTDLVGTKLLSRERASRCGEEWRGMRAAWQKRLA